MKLNIYSLELPTPLPPPAFSFNVSSLDVMFTDETAGTNISWLWDFGDGNTSTVQNPTHTYAVPGTYTVRLTVNGGQYIEHDIVAVAAPTAIADFTYTVMGGSVYLTSTSTDASSWSWDFGDGSGTSTDENPSYEYSTADTFTVTLTVNGGEDSISYDVTIEPLVYAIPDTTGFNVLYVEDIEGTTQTLYSDQNYHIKHRSLSPQPATGRITLNIWVNAANETVRDGIIVVEGVESDIPAPVGEPFTSTPYPSYGDRVAFGLQDRTEAAGYITDSPDVKRPSLAWGGKLYLVGCKFGGEGITEGIQLACFAADVYIQQCSVKGIHSVYNSTLGYHDNDSDNHPDLIQTYRGVKSLFIDRFTGTTAYQGLFFKDDRGDNEGNDPAPGEDYGFNREAAPHGEVLAQYVNVSSWISPYVGEIFTNSGLWHHTRNNTTLSQHIWGKGVWIHHPTKDIDYAVFPSADDAGVENRPSKVTVSGIDYAYYTNNLENGGTQMLPSISGVVGEGSVTDMVSDDEVGVGYTSPPGVASEWILRHHFYGVGLPNADDSGYTINSVSFPVHATDKATHSVGAMTFICRFTRPSTGDCRLRFGDIEGDQDNQDIYEITFQTDGDCRLRRIDNGYVNNDLVAFTGGVPSGSVIRWRITPNGSDYDISVDYVADDVNAIHLDELFDGSETNVFSYTDTPPTANGENIGNWTVENGLFWSQDNGGIALDDAELYYLVEN